ncbi:MAG: glutathione S-transferase [Myxococcales bacterium]|nr:glutathione S-transferase [Myxococcales bacterium]
MSLRLVVGPLNYSSWSVRPWLALKYSGLPFKTHTIDLFVDPEWHNKVLQFSGAGKVPVLIDGNLSVHESLAICEYVSELAPDAKLWPEDRAQRARARAISCEMLGGFPYLRGEMGMNGRARAKAFRPSAEAQREIARVSEVWSASLQSLGGPYLFGHFTIADCMYFPVVTRLRTYGVELSGDAADYCATIWEHPIVAEWEKLAAESVAIPEYDAPFV